MLEVLNVTEVIFAVALIFMILIQQKSVTLNLSSMWGWMGAVTKRWPEKVLHNLTIFLATCFTINSLLFFLLY